jgi:hypoxanthine phosphoribosyltransferase
MKKRPSVNFAHPSEVEFARILDFYGVRWEYEPRSFPLRWEGDRIVEMFTPDFYLIDLDLYVELTTLKQSLVTEKNRKLRHLRELHPDINIRLLYRRDYHRLLAKFGYGPLAEADVRGIERVLISVGELEQRTGAHRRAQGGGAFHVRSDAPYLSAPIGGVDVGLVLQR